MKKIIVATAIACSTLLTSYSQSWGFTLGNGAGFYYGNNNGSGGGHRQRSYQCANVYYNSYAPTYYAPPPVVYYRQPDYIPGAINRTIPYTFNTSYQIRYQNCR